MGVPKGTSIGIDLSNPVRVVAFSQDTGQTVGVLTAKTPFEAGSKTRLKELADEIRGFCKPLKARLSAAAGLPMSGCLLFTMAMPKMNKREFAKAVQFETERLAPGGSDAMRTVVREWPKELPAPPSLKVTEGNSLYLVAAADARAVLSAGVLMKMAGLRSSGVEVAANPASRASWWLWGHAKSADTQETGKSAAVSSTSETLGLGTQQGSEVASTASYRPWLTHGNGTPSGSAVSGAGTNETELQGAVLSGKTDAEPVQEDAGEDSPSTILDIAIVARASEAMMYLSYGACPWLTREIPLDPDNPFVNGQILSGEITRSARFARASAKGRVEGRVTVFGESDRVSFLADFLKEQTGLRTLLWGRPALDMEPEYGVAAGLVLSHEGGAKP